MNVEALKALYVALGGALTDTYADIADGVPVSEYSLICDVISAIAKVAGGTADSPVYVGEAFQVGTAGVDESTAQFSLDMTFGEVFDMLNSRKNVSFIAQSDTYPPSAVKISVTAATETPSEGQYRIQAIRTYANHASNYQTTILALIGEGSAEETATLSPVSEQTT